MAGIFTSYHVIPETPIRPRAALAQAFFARLLPKLLPKPLPKPLLKPLPKPLPKPFLGAGLLTILVLCLPSLWALATKEVSRAAEPLPDARTLLQEVQAHQAELDKARENYTFHSTETVRELDKNGALKKTETEEDEIFFVNGHEVHKLIRKNGKDLSAEQAAREQERVNKEAQKDAQPSRASHEEEDITVGRLLQIVAFSNPRRVNLNGRNTIALDFAGDPHAKTHGRDESALKKVSGTVWIDERDREVSRMSAILDDNYHVGLGLFASVAKGSNVVFDQALIHNEAWLPTQVELHLQAKALLVVGIRAEVGIRFDNYRKFQADAVQQPGATVKPSP